MMETGLKDKVVIVTGGAGGIGLATGYIVAGFTSVDQRLSVVDLLSRQFRLVPEFDAAVLRGVTLIPSFSHYASGARLSMERKYSAKSERPISWVAILIMAS